MDKMKSLRCKEIKNASFTNLKKNSGKSQIFTNLKMGFYIIVVDVTCTCICVLHSFITNHCKLSM